MNDLQKVEFELFKVFKKTCEKLNLNYFLVCGSCLGAARHGGFIPWDDDMDVGMFRDDYNKFMKLAPTLLPDGIFLQNYISDPNYLNIAAKLRNSNTTYIEKMAADLDINHGVYLDIFPLDGYPETYYEQKKLIFLKKWYVRQLMSAFKLPPTFKGKLSVLVFRLFGCQKRNKSIIRKYETLISKYSIKDSKVICNHATWHGKRDFIPVEIYGKGTKLQYEGITVIVPQDYDAYLTSLYSDWRTLPSPEKQKGHHYYVICDIEKPYTHYIKIIKKKMYS